MALSVKEQLDLLNILKTCAFAHGFRAEAIVSDLGGIFGSLSQFNDSFLTQNQVLSGAGAVSVATVMTHLTTTAVGQALTLAKGTFVGQRKHIIAKIGYTGGKTSVVTVTSFADGTTVTFLAKFDAAELYWDGTNWNVVLLTGTAAVA